MQAYLAAADSESGNGPAWVALVVAAVAFVAAVVTAILAYLGNRKTSQVAADANRIAQQAADVAATMDRREEWWKRAQWAMERACDAGPRTREIGAHVLDALAQSGLAHQEEKNMIAQVLVVIATTP